MAKPDSWMPLFWRDWQMTRRMTNAEKGALIELLLYLDDEDSLPTDNATLARIGQAYGRGEWARVRVAVMEFFELKGDGYVLKPDVFKHYQRHGIKVANPLRPPAEVWRLLRAEVFERDDYTCTYCGTRGGVLNCDHVIPISRGGSNELDNLTTACAPCNRSKRAKTPEEWRGANI